MRMHDMKKGYLEVGKVVNSRGICGELKIEHWCDSQEAFCKIKKIYFDINKAGLNVTRLRPHKSFVLMQIDNINTQEQANALKGKILYADRDDIQIEENSYFIEDLKGLKVVDIITGQNYGILNNVFKAGFNDVYSVISESGKEYLVPIIEGTIDKIDLEQSKIFINPISGVFDEN